MLSLSGGLRGYSTGQLAKSHGLQNSGNKDEPLWDKVVEATENAKKKGALYSMDNSPRLVQDGPIKFVVRIATALLRKPNENPLAKSSQDPFMDPEPELTVRDDASATHQLLLNKFNVVDYHLLIVTKEYEPQTDLLNAGDFEAASRVTQEIDGLLFYNSGKNSGASQPHKHLQFVPLPLVPGDMSLPIDAAINAANAPPNTPFQIPAFKFVHACAVLDPPLARIPSTESGRGAAAREEARMLHNLYLRCFEATGVDYRNEQLRKTGKISYNFLLSRNWMLIVVRAAEKCGSISVNSLGYSGTLLVKSEGLFDELSRTGPLNVLHQCAMAWPGPPPPSVLLSADGIASGDSNGSRTIGTSTSPSALNSVLASSPANASILAASSPSSPTACSPVGSTAPGNSYLNVHAPMPRKHPSPVRHEPTSHPPPRPQSQLQRGPSPVMQWPAPQQPLHP